MTKSEIIERFCKLATLVGGEHFNHFKAHDCFCAAEAEMPGFQFDEEILTLIELAVKEKLAKKADDASTPTMDCPCKSAGVCGSCC